VAGQLATAGFCSSRQLEEARESYDSWAKTTLVKQTLAMRTITGIVPVAQGLHMTVDMLHRTDRRICKHQKKSSLGQSPLERPHTNQTPALNAFRRDPPLSIGIARMG
jgi:hypothetical protein